MIYVKAVFVDDPIFKYYCLLSLRTNTVKNIRRGTGKLEYIISNPEIISPDGAEARIHL